jgi:hypothetical protein
MLRASVDTSVFLGSCLQVAPTTPITARRGQRQTADAAPITARDITRRDSKDSLSTPAVSFRARANSLRNCIAFIRSGRTILGPSHLEATRMNRLPANQSIDRMATLEAI